MPDVGPQVGTFGNPGVKRKQSLGGRSVTTFSTNQLRLHEQRCSESAQPDIENVASLSDLLRAFEEATGWSLAYHCGSKPIHSTEFAWSAPADPGVGTTPGHVRLDLVRSASAASESRAAPKAVRRLASALEELVADLVKTQHALADREAELAAAVPVVVRPGEHSHLAGRLHAVLRGGAEAVGCHAAALYLLDDATTSLKLRCSWGLPRDRLAQPPRPLRGALADLEAMLGHAVVLEDSALFQQWNPPENFPAAVCVPVATPTAILGTLWVFCNSRRDCNDRETNILEVVAGRLASDLEREILLQEGADGAQIKRQLDAAERIQRNQLPTIPPLIQGWDLAGWTCQAQTVGGEFYDWFSLAKGSVAFAVGDVAERGIEAALIASTLKAALRSHGQYHRNADSLLTQVNLTLWTGSAGDQSASVACGFIEANADRVRYASAGRAGLMVLRTGHWDSIPADSAPLGHSPESQYRQEQCQLQPGNVMLIFSEGLRDALKGGDTVQKREAHLAQALTSRLSLPAKDIAAAVKRCIADRLNLSQSDDRTILVLKRTNS
jgi:serine phosphatase RsbU (regulator of sigma subunit)